MGEQAIHVLLIDRDLGESERVRSVLREVEEPEIHVSTADRIEAGLERIARDQIDLVLVNLSITGDGLDAVDELRLQYPDLPVVTLTGPHEERLAYEAMQAGAQDYIDKAEMKPSRVGRTLRFAIERQRKESELRSVSLMDDRTGLYNRAGFLILAQHQLRLAQRAQKKALVLAADIDGMKEIQARFGPAASQGAIMTVGKILREVFRDGDVIARIGRDEFSVFVTDAHQEQLERLTDRVNEQLALRNLHSELELSLSYGMAVFDPARPASAEELLTQASGSIYKRQSMPSKPGEREKAKLSRPHQ